MGYNIALSGLTAAAEAIDVTSNNIANSQTVGYKAGQYVFADQFFRAQDPQSKDRSGMGTQRQVIRRDQNYGTVTGTQNPLDLALTGPGMFVLAKQASNNVPTETPSVFQYSRNGQFGVDSQNRIVNESGMFVVGYPATPDGTQTTQASFSVLSLDPAPKAANPSTQSTIALNINNGGNTIQAPFDPNNSASYTQSTSQTVYDSAGNPHTLSNFYAKTDPATLYLYPQGGGGSRTSATQFSFNPKQDTSAQADLFGANNNLTGIINGVSSAQSIGTTALAANGTIGSSETLAGCTLTALPAGQTSTYQLMLNDGTKLMVTAQPGVDGSGNQVTRYAYTADRYKVYATVDGINVNRSIDVASQIGQGYVPKGVLSGVVALNGGVATTLGTTVTPGTHTVTIPSPAVGGDPATASITVVATGVPTASTLNTFSGGVPNHYVLTGLTSTHGSGGTVTVDLTSATTATVSVSGGTLYQAGDIITIPSGALGSGSSATTVTVNTVTGGALTTGTINAFTGGTAPYVLTGLNTNGIGTGGTFTVNLTSSTAGTVSVSGGNGYAANDTVTIPAGALGAGSAATTLTIGTITANSGKISAINITNGGSGFATGSITLAASLVTGAPDTGAYTIPIGASNIGVANSSVTAISVGGAITGSAPAGTYTLGSTQTNNALAGTFAGSTVANLGGVAGTYSVNVVGGTGSGGVALINYAGNGVITGIQLSGGSGYTAANTLTIPAGALGSGSTALTLGSVGAGNLLTGTFLGMHDAGGNNVLSAQAVQAGSAGGVQTFTFTNGISITMSTPAGDDVGAIAGNLNGKTITIANNPTGTMGFVAGKNIDSLARDQFGVPAYTTNTTITTSVGSGTRVNNLALNIDSTNMTAYTAAEQTYTSTTNGNPLSQLTGYSFDNKGNLVASYGDGTTMIKGQLAIASFNNTEGLIPVGLNSFQVSGTTGMTSGAAVYGTANSGNFGAVQGKAVESSNVDLTGELVKLMTLQRLYTANSQAVKIEAATLVDDAIRIGQ